MPVKAPPPPLPDGGGWQLPRSSFGSRRSLLNPRRDVWLEHITWRTGLGWVFVVDSPTPRRSAKAVPQHVASCFGEPNRGRPRSPGSRGGVWWGGGHFVLSVSECRLMSAWAGRHSSGFAAALRAIRWEPRASRNGPLSDPEPKVTRPLQPQWTLQCTVLRTGLTGCRVLTCLSLL